MPVLFHNPFAFAPFYRTALAFHGRRENRRTIAQTVSAMVVEDSIEPLPDAVAPTQARLFSVLFPASFWRDVTPPQIGEWICYKIGSEELWCKADSVKRMPNGDFSIIMTWEPERRPPWLR